VCGKAREFMKSVVKTLKESNVVESIDSAALDMLARSYSLYVKANEELENQSLTIVNNQGNIVANPIVKIIKDAQTSCMQIMTEFGLTAKSRKKLPRLDKKEGDESPLDEFVKKANRMK
jgi:P27 family predicted phage terminase small subunit